MQKIILRAKHWQLFIVQFVIPFILYIIMIMVMIGEIVKNPNEPPVHMFSAMKFIIPMVIIVSFGTLFSWFWSVGHAMQERVPDHLKLNLKLFKAFVIFPVVYFLVISLLMMSMIPSPEEMHQVRGFGGPVSPFPFNPALLLLIIPFHFFSIFCVFYCFYFVSKSIKTVELNREVTFGDYVGEFFLSWFFFIGVWILQPRVNQLTKTDNSMDF